MEQSVMSHHHHPEQPYRYVDGISMGWVKLIPVLSARLSAHLRDNPTRAPLAAARPLRLASEPAHAGRMRKRMLKSHAKEDGVVVDPSKCPISVASIADASAEYQSPVARMQQRACALSDVKEDEAHEVDDYNLARSIGEYNIMMMAEKFHNRCLAVKEDWFYSMFQHSERETMNANFAEYMLQRLGGDNLYNQSKGCPFPSLAALHSGFEVSARTAQRWCECMDETLEEMEAENTLRAEQRRLLFNFLKYEAYYLVAVQEAQLLNCKMGDYDVVKKDLLYEHDRLL